MYVVLRAGNGWVAVVSVPFVSGVLGVGRGLSVTVAGAAVLPWSCLVFVLAVSCFVFICFVLGAVDYITKIKSWEQKSLLRLHLRRVARPSGSDALTHRLGNESAQQDTTAARGTTPSAPVEL